MPLSAKHKASFSSSFLKHFSFYLEHTFSNFLRTCSAPLPPSCNYGAETGILSTVREQVKLKEEVKKSRKQSRRPNLWSRGRLPRNLSKKTYLWKSLVFSIWGSQIHQCWERERNIWPWRSLILIKNPGATTAKFWSNFHLNSSYPWA